MTNRFTKKIRAVLLPLFLILTFFACENDEVNIPEGAFDEHQVNLQGAWKINRVLQNGVDVTGRFDFSGLRLTLAMDAAGPTTYQIDNAGAPFVILKNGDWSMNDNIYPTSMTFSDGNEQKTVNFSKPPISTNNSFSINLVLGCADNVYTYEFGKV